MDQWEESSSYVEVPWRKKKKTKKNVALCQQPTFSGPLEKSQDWGFYETYNWSGGILLLLFSKGIRELKNAIKYKPSYITTYIFDKIRKLWCWVIINSDFDDISFFTEFLHKWLILFKLFELSALQFSIFNSQV